LDFPLINQIEQSRRYWIVVGAPGSGKTTVAKYLENQYQMVNIEFEPYVAGLK
jgi:broad-specificity NMP kinase